MPSQPSPAFSINGNPVGSKASVAAGATVTATISDITGVSPVTWTLINTDDTSATTDYTLTPSGSVNQVCETTALTAGTAAELQCTVAGGVDPTTGYPSTDMTTTVKFYVPTTAGLEVFVSGEVEDDSRIGSSTHGMLTALNAAVRQATGAESVTITSDDLTTAGVGPEAEVVFAVPTNGRVLGHDINLTDAFDNGAGVSLTVTIGTTADVDSILSNFDAFTGSANEGVPGGGTLGRRFTGNYGGDTINAYFTSGADQLVNYTNGSLTIELYYAVVPA